jgi:hypothetical protein
MKSLIENYSMNSPSRGTNLSPDAIVSRILFALVNEGFKILEDGIASDPSKIDIIYLYGYGWPAWRGKFVHPCRCKYFHYSYSQQISIWVLKVGQCFGQTIMLDCPCYYGNLRRSTKCILIANTFAQVSC